MSKRCRAVAAAYVPNDPFFDRQWYATQNQSFDSWTEQPPLAAVRVAVIDSGIDGRHPELRNRIVAAKSFVKGPPTVDTQGHGTFVAGLIAAETNDGVGIAGLAPPAELLIAKVVGPQRSIPVEAEAKAIRWAVDNGARVINMSLSGLRDPQDPSRDTYSQLEADAISYAVSKGVLVVAAVGNSDQSPSEPWPYAGWPAALPHVVGVSALNRKGAAPTFSNRDPQFNDIAAPGEDILSTFPLTLTAAHPDCDEQGYSSCGPEEYRMAEGTSFAAPQVTAAAAMLFATSPEPHRRSGGNDPRPELGRRRACERLRDVHGRPRSVHGRRATRPGRCPRAPRRGGAAARPLRAERRRRHQRVPALRLQPPDRCDTRLLERSGRRLPRLPAQG